MNRVLLDSDRELGVSMLCVCESGMTEVWALICMLTFGWRGDDLVDAGLRCDSARFFSCKRKKAHDNNTHTGSGFRSQVKRSKHEV